MLALVGLALSGCRLGLTAGATLEPGGHGRASLVIRMDEALLDALDGLSIDPTAEVTAAASAAQGWSLERTATEDGAVEVTLSHPIERPAEIGEAFRELTSGLSNADPALLVDIEVALDDDGVSHVNGMVGFRAPRTAGAFVDGEPVGPPSAQLRARASEVVAPTLEVSLPGRVVDHDADRVDGRTLSWEIPTDGARAVSAEAAIPAIYQQPWLWVAVVVALAAGGVAASIARRGRRQPA